MKELLIYGKDRVSGKMIHINVAKNGKKCNCVCSWCGETLIARQGESNAAHFAHASDRYCEFAGESALHLLAKEILSEANQIWLPGDLVFSYSQAKIEKALAAFRPDAILVDEDKHLHVEIFVTHKTGFHKERFFYDNGLDAIEIDLSQIDRDISKEDLHSIVIDEISRKHFLCKKQELTPEIVPQIQVQNGAKVVAQQIKKESEKSAWYPNIWNLLGIAILIALLSWIARTVFIGKKKKRYYRY